MVATPGAPPVTGMGFGLAVGEAPSVAAGIAAEAVNYVPFDV